MTDSALGRTGQGPVAGAMPPFWAPVVGSFTDAAGGRGTLRGIYKIEEFVAQHGQLAAAAVVAGRLLDSTGEVVGIGSRRLTTAVRGSSTASTLDLEVGPLMVNLAGLMVDIDALAIQVRPESGPEEITRDLLATIAADFDECPGGRALLGLNLLVRLVEGEPTEGEGPLADGDPAYPAGGVLPASPVGVVLPASPHGAALPAPPDGVALPTPPDGVVVPGPADEPRREQL